MDGATYPILIVVGDLVVPSVHSREVFALALGKALGGANRLADLTCLREVALEWFTCWIGRNDELQFWSTLRTIKLCCESPSAAEPVDSHNEHEHPPEESP